MRAKLVALLLVVTSSALPRGSSAAIIAVDCEGGADYLTIQEAVDAAADGDTISVAPCLYEENVLISGKLLSIVGSGTDVTRIHSNGPEPAIRISLSGVASSFRITDLTVTRSPENSNAIWWRGCGLKLIDCDTGRLEGGGVDEYAGHAHLTRSTVAALSVTGPARTSVIEDSDIVGRALFSCTFLEDPGHAVTSTASHYGELELACTVAHLSLDAVDDLVVHGGMDVWAFVYADDSAFGHIFVSRGPEVELTRCTVDAISGEEAGDGYYPLVMLECLVTGDIVLTDAEVGSFRFDHNTFLGSFSYEAATDRWMHYFRSNIVCEEFQLEAESGHFAIHHNDFAGGATIVAPGDSVYANISEDPLFCDELSGDYTLQDCSPCVGAAHDGGDMGAYGIGCECFVAVQRSSWGAIKSLYR
jgi:hypothetical protein